MHYVHQHIMAKASSQWLYECVFWSVVKAQVQQNPGKTYNPCFDLFKLRDLVVIGFPLPLPVYIRTLGALKNRAVHGVT